MNYLNESMDSTLLRQHNRTLIFNLLRLYGPISRADLTKKTGMSPTSIGRLINILIEEGYAKEIGYGQNILGRKATLVDLDYQNILSIGVNIDIPTTYIGITDLSGKVTDIHTMPFDKACSTEDFCDHIIEKINQLIHQLQTLRPNAKLIGIGCALPGQVSWPNGILIFSPQLGWSNFPIRNYIQDRICLHLPVYVDNDVKCIAASEILIKKTDAVNNFVVIKIGSGLGAAIVTNNELLRGYQNIIGEIGHIIIQPDGPLCDCGRHGCLQTFVSIPGLESRSGLTIHELIQRMYQGQTEAFSLLNNAAEYASLWTANLVNLYNPQKILFYGSLFLEWPDMLTHIQKRFYHYYWTEIDNPPTIEFLNINTLNEHSSSTNSVYSATAHVFSHEIIGLT